MRRPKRTRFRPALQRLENRSVPAAGMLDPTFGVWGKVTTRFGYPSNESARCVAIDRFGRIVVAGDVDNGVNSDFMVARLTPAGALDTTFGGTGVVTLDLGGS